VARLDYANARIGARRARLLGREALHAVLARSTQEARVEALRASPLGPCIPREVGTGDEALGVIERALRADVRREALAILAYAEGRRARALLAAFLGLEEAVAVKSVLRGVVHGAPIDVALASAPVVPELPEASLRAAAAASTLDDAVATLERAGSTVAAAVRPELPGFSQDGLLPLEIAADRAAIARATAVARVRGEDAALLSAYLADRVDGRNAATLLALAGSAGAEWFVPGGRRIAEQSFRTLAGAPAEAVRAAVEAAFPGVAPAAAEPWAVDRALEQAALAPLWREMRRRPLSIAVPLAYLLARRAEVTRVALVLRGAALGLPGDEILDLVEA
jgi:V/A-type H+-transporting ATPase subunit C